MFIFKNEMSDFKNENIFSKKKMFIFKNEMCDLKKKEYCVIFKTEINVLKKDF